MKRILTALTLSALLVSPAWSGFIDEKATWGDMSRVQKLGYVQGLFDMHIVTLKGDNKEWEKVKERNFKCVLDAKMKADDLVELIDTMYRNDVAIWNNPPLSALLQGLHKMCG